MKRLLLAALVLLLVVLGTVLVLAPAQWAAAAVRQASGGHVDLAEASGTLWNGSATVVLAADDQPGAPRASLPERLQWQLSPWPLLLGTVDLTLSHPSALAQPLSFRLTPGGQTVLGATTLRLPAALLTGLGAPWNTIRPGGSLIVQWGRLQVDGRRMSGDISAEWRDASSSLTPVSPFGHYRLDLRGGYPNTQLQLRTVRGPLELTGDGTIAEGGRLRFEGVARPMAEADPTIKNQLAGLIALLGRREGDAAQLRFGS